MQIAVLLFCSSAYSELSLNGSAILKDLGKQQFVAGLFVDTLQNNANTIQLEDAPKHMEVRILSNYSKRRWINLWMQSISINNDRESFSGSAQEVIDIMQAPKSAPQKGDIIKYIYHPKHGASMRFNGTELISNYPKNIFNILLKTWIGPIPPYATFKNQQGTVRIGTVVDRSGELLSVTATQESNYKLLNQAALKAVKKAAPFPALPEGIKADNFELNLPITFRLQ